MEKVVINLLQGKYGEVEKICKSMDDNDIKEMLMTVAYELESVVIYSFIQYMIIKEKKEFWIKLAIDIMLNPLCFYEGAYSIALFHTRELLKIKKNVNNLERIIFFYNIPEKLVEDVEVKKIAEEILILDSTNKVAIEVLDKLQRP